MNAIVTNQSRRVVARPNRPSLRLPASVWTEPGIRKLRATSHHARRVMTVVEPVCGSRIGAEVPVKVVMSSSRFFSHPGSKKMLRRNPGAKKHAAATSLVGENRRVSRPQQAAHGCARGDQILGVLGADNPGRADKAKPDSTLLEFRVSNRAAEKHQRPTDHQEHRCGSTRCIRLHLNPLTDNLQAEPHQTRSHARRVQARCHGAGEMTRRARRFEHDLPKGVTRRPIHPGGLRLRHSRIIV